jgi:hypothetical protein
MTIRALPNQPIADTLDVIWYWFNFMRTASPTGPGWTVSRSSNGLVGGAGDNIALDRSTGRTDINRYNGSTQRSWFVLRAPDGSLEYLFYKTDTTSGLYQVGCSPSGSFTGGGAFAVPTASDAVYFHADSPPSAATCLQHVVADDAAPYGWFLFTHVAGSPTAYRYAMSHIPMDAVAVSGDTAPWVFYYDGGGAGYTRTAICNEYYGSSENHCYARNPGNSGGAEYCTAMYLRNEQGDFFPENVEILPGGEDAALPITFGRRMALGTGFFKGISSFMRWNGRTRAIGEMFEAKTRVSVGVVNFPWDGASAFLMS